MFSEQLTWIVNIGVFAMPVLLSCPIHWRWSCQLLAQSGHALCVLAGYCVDVWQQYIICIVSNVEALLALRNAFGLSVDLCS